MNLLITTYWRYADPLIQTYTLPYLRLISSQLPDSAQLHLVTFETDETLTDALSQQCKRDEKANGIVLHRLKYHTFSARALLQAIKSIYILGKIVRRERIDQVHAWCMPGAVFGYITAKRFGLPLVVDSYEPHAEAMVENGTWKANSFAFRLLFGFEKRISRYASKVIACVPGMQQYAIEKYGHCPKFYVKPACIEFEQFTVNGSKEDLASKLGLENKIVAVYAGKFGGIYLDSAFFDLIKVCADFWGERFRLLLLSNEPKDRIKNFAEAAGLDQSILVQRFVAHDEVPNYLNLADFAICPVKSVPTKRYCTPIKDGEYWAMGLPVIITPNISEDSEIIQNEAIGAVLKGLSKASYERAVAEIDSLLNGDRDALKERIRQIGLQKRSFEIAEEVYRKIYGN